LFSSIDVVTKEKVVGFWWETAIFEKSEKVVILSVNVTWSWPGSGKKEKKKDVKDRKGVPQILMGASSSRRIGWVMKISRAFVQRCLISYS
jgi:hypothetical protein